MKTFEINIFTIITLFQLTPSLQEACGVARVIQVSNETGSSPQTHFPWAGALYSVVNKTMAGDMKYICGATLVSESFSVTGNLNNEDVKWPTHAIDSLTFSWPLHLWQAFGRLPTSAESYYFIFWYLRLETKKHDGLGVRENFCTWRLESAWWKLRRWHRTFEAAQINRFHRYN